MNIRCDIKACPYVIEGKNMKNKCKGFTIVELVIVIAVIAVLAAVAIPTFSAIVKRANISTDTQIVRNMNVILTAECADKSAPMTAAEVRNLMVRNGISNFRPETKFFTYYWIENKNVIVLANESDIVVYPEEYIEENGSKKWHDLDVLVSVELPNRRPDNADENETRLFNITVTQSGTSVLMPFDIPKQVEAYSSFEISLLIPEQYTEAPNDFSLRTITARMRAGDDEYKVVVRSAAAQISGYKDPFRDKEPAVLSIPCVTGDIEINIDIVEWCQITFLGDGINAGSGKAIMRTPRNSGRIMLDDQILWYWLKPGEMVTSAKATTASGVELGDLYNAQYDRIEYRTSGLMEDMTVQLTLEPRTYDVNFTLKNSAGIIYQPQEPLKATYSEEHECFALVIDLKTIAGAENVTEILNNLYELEKKLSANTPVFTYDAAENTITVTNIKCNFKWICNVK